MARNFSDLSKGIKVIHVSDSIKLDSDITDADRMFTAKAKEYFEDDWYARYCNNYNDIIKNHNLSKVKTA